MVMALLWSCSESYFSWGGSRFLDQCVKYDVYIRLKPKLRGWRFYIDFKYRWRYRSRYSFEGRVVVPCGERDEGVVCCLLVWNCAVSIMFVMRSS